ncbi:hypothetical protein [Bifidobacterium mongoliense]|jgi:hypothetical protein|nr:hypothetical protein [Bifidobacterium mongoliense]
MSGFITFNASVARILNLISGNDFENVRDEENKRFAALASLDVWEAEHE